MSIKIREPVKESVEISKIREVFIDGDKPEMDEIKKMATKAKINFDNNYDGSILIHPHYASEEKNIDRFVKEIQKKFKASVKESIKEEKVTLMYSPREIRDWLYEHEQATEDCLNYFKAKRLESINIEDIKDWISEHDELFADFKRYFRVNESKEPRIVEYISPERQEVLDRVREIDNKWSEKVTEDDVMFLKDNGLDYDYDRGRITRNGKVFIIPSRATRKFDFLDAVDKHEQRGTITGSRDRDVETAPRPVYGSGQANRTSDELKRTAQELRFAKGWGTDRQQKVWQGKHDREAARLKNLRSDAENKKWRQEQNDEMKRPYKELRNINFRLKDENPDDNSYGNYSYDADIRRAEMDKAKREQELLKRYEDELKYFQDKIDDAKAEKEYAIARKNKLLRRPAVEVDETEVDETEIEEAYAVDDNQMRDWKNICRAWCKKNGAELLFVNETSFGCEMPNGQLRHIYIDELADMLGGVTESCKRESIGSDLGEFQKWVDYDMDKYGKVSNNTMSKIRKAGLTLVKDDYGDWEVIAKRPIKREEQSNPDDEI